MYFALMLVVLLLVNEARTHTIIRKCCDAYEILAGDGRSCKEAPWTRNYTLSRDDTDADVILPPFDEEWVRYWMPPGLPLEMITVIFLRSLENISPSPDIQSVNVSSIWNPDLAYNDGHWRKIMVFNGYDQIISPKGKSFDYCVDAARPPLGPFGLLLKINYLKDDYIYKCCESLELLVTENGTWMCLSNEKGIWSRYNSSFFNIFEAKYTFMLSLTNTTVSEKNGILCPEGRPRTVHLVPGDRQSVILAKRRIHDLHFSSRETCIDYQLHEDESLTETVLYCEYSRITRGVYWILRPLSLVSVLLLMAALVGIATSKRMNSTAHGWSLACHAACLLGFNLGQATYYLAVSDYVDQQGFIPLNVQSICAPLALSMYFLLTASASWLTAVCVNMSMGFRKLQVARAGGGDRKRFLALSAFAWGLPTAMTAACSAIFKSTGASVGILFSDPWYTPRLAETRTCYGEEAAYAKFEVSSLKSGTALFFYGPMGALVLVNAFFLWRTIQQVQFLRRGNSVLRREEDLGARRQRKNEETDGQCKRMAEAESGSENKSDDRKGGKSSTALDTRNIRLYLKMLLMSGVIDITTESIAWSITSVTTDSTYSHLDYSLAYRATGYATDFFKASCVTWFAAPEEGYIGAVRGRLQGDKRGRGPGRGPKGAK